MTLAGFKASNHPQQTAKRGAVDDVDDRETHPENFAPLNERFRFTLDVAAAPHNAKCIDYYTRYHNGLRLPWEGRVWCNPPYLDIRSWVKKAWYEWDQGCAEVIVMLLPANRVEQKWWQELVEPHRDRPGSDLRVEFLPGRMRFIRPNAVIGRKGDRPPFGCCLLIWGAPVGDIYAEVRAERDRAHAKHGDTSMESQPADAWLRLSILMEEVGEVAREFNEGRHRGTGPDRALLRKELIQTAAMAAAWADALGGGAS